MFRKGRKQRKKTLGLGEEQHKIFAALTDRKKERKTVCFSMLYIDRKAGKCYIISEIR